MNAAYGLNARVVDNKAIYIEARYPSTTVCVYGATMPLSCKLMGRHDRGVENFTLYPETGKDGIVAVCISNQNGTGKNIYRSFTPNFLKISWKDGQLSIDLERAWVAVERIGQVNQYCIEVYIDGMRLTTPDVDGSLLCRYLWGTASKDEVLAVVAKKQEELSAVEKLKELESAHSWLEQKYRESGAEVGRLRGEIASLKLDCEKTEKLESEYAKAIEAIVELNGFIRLAFRDMGTFRRRFMPDSWRTLGDVSARIENDFEPSIIANEK